MGQGSKLGRATARKQARPQGLAKDIPMNFDKMDKKATKEWSQAYRAWKVRQRKLGGRGY